MKKIIKDILLIFAGNKILKILDARVEEGPALFFYLASQLDANAVVGVNLDYQLLSGDNNLLLLVATGTAIKIVAVEAQTPSPKNSQKLEVNVANLSLFENMQ